LKTALPLKSREHLPLFRQVSAGQGLSEIIDVYLGKHVYDKTEQGFSETTETIDVYQGIHVHDKAEQGFSETTEAIDVYQGIHVYDKSEQEFS